MIDLRVDLCVIGAGAAGLTAASIAAQLGAKVALIERDRMGGECLNTGCVPSKALLAASKAAHVVRASGRFGVEPREPLINFGAVHRHVHDVIARIAPHDSAERFERMGVEVIRAEARFVEARVIAAGEHRVRARRVIIATGSSPATPRVAGLDDVEYFTNETIFDNFVLPRHLVVLGGGPLGIELAQAHRRLGARVTVIEQAKVMPRDDPELVARLLESLAGEGVVVRENASVRQVRRVPSGILLSIDEGGQPSELEASHVLIATGRRPRVASLDLERAQIRYTDRGVVVDARLRTTVPGVFAIGDVVDAPRFTHIARYHASLAVQNALFLPFAKARYDSLPWVTYTDPELAQVGASEVEARKTYGDDLVVVRVEMNSNDRAQAERATEGAVKLLARKNGRIVGASILDAHAGELAHLWVLAIQSRLKLRNVARMIAPYPTLGEANRMAAIEFYRPRLFGPWTRRLVHLFGRLP